MDKRRTSLFFFLFSIVFLYLPLIFLVVYSFNDSKAMVWQGFSLRWYRELFLYSDELWRAFRYSVFIALISSSISTIIGTLGAIGLHWHNFKFKKYLKIIVFLPLIVPEIIMGVSLLILFVTIKLQLGLMSIIIVHTTVNIPFVLFIVLSRLAEIDYSLVEASYDLGATEFQTLKKIILPLLIPAIISGFLIAFTLSFDDFVATFFVAGPGSTTLPLRIYSMIRIGVSPVINSLSVLFIGFATILTLSTTRLQKYFIH
ncbi:ABC transporter permease [Fusobacterium perfoetens]|uniref:ABC transporter permease n=1 Tax=Fusobacterium perfoetens TaxID=852 RepID=UPI0026F33551|nr:ABC transporter permease [Fusobacterium perfoetens]